MARGSMKTYSKEDQRFTYSFATISVRHIPELQGFVDDLDSQGQLSDHSTYREYVTGARYGLPEGFGTSGSIIAIAIMTPLMKARFHPEGIPCDVFIPPQYYNAGVTRAALEDCIRTDVLQGGKHKLERLPSGYLKLLSVRSGLGQYGRNNICYVDGMGSFLTLYAYVTDLEALHDEWTDLRAMPLCSTCEICRNACPTGAIPEETFVIDAGKCLPLYNEIPGEIPAWIPTEAHTSLMGCMHCQFPCPANREAVAQAGRFPDVSEEETAAILADAPNAESLASASEKLRIALAHDDIRDLVSRNLRAVFRNC